MQRYHQIPTNSSPNGTERFFRRQPSSGCLSCDSFSELHGARAPISTSCSPTFLVELRVHHRTASPPARFISSHLTALLSSHVRPVGSGFCSGASPGRAQQAMAETPQYTRLRSNADIRLIRARVDAIKNASVTRSSTHIYLSTYD